MSLLDCLQKHQGTKTAIASASSVTFADIVEPAIVLRNKYSHYQGRAVGVSYRNLDEFVFALCAFDSFCSSLYLIPDLSVLPEKALNSPSLILWPQDKVIDVQEKKEKGTDSSTNWFIATSGTTAKPKWIKHNLESLTRSVKTSESMAALSWGLLYQPFRFAGLQVLLQALISGSSIADASSGEISDRLAILNSSNTSAISATPGLWRQMMMSDSFADLQLTHVTLGGEIADQALINGLAKAFPKAKVRHIYASTEAGVGFIVSDKKAGFPSDWLDNDEVAAPMMVDEEGYLWIKPPFTVQLAQCDELNKGRFINTLDLVEIIDNRVFFLGRANGVINVGGNKVHPERVEQVILEVDGIQSAYVYGKRNSVLGQLVQVDVVSSGYSEPSNLKSAIIQQCKSRLERYEVPTSVKFVDALEMTSAGKLKRSDQ